MYKALDLRKDLVVIRATNKLWLGDVETSAHSGELDPIQSGLAVRQVKVMKELISILEERISHLELC